MSKGSRDDDGDSTRQLGVARPSRRAPFYAPVTRRGKVPQRVVTLLAGARLGHIVRRAVSMVAYGGVPND